MSSEPNRPLPKLPLTGETSVPATQICANFCAWRDVALPIVVSIASFCTFNALWNLPQLALYDLLRPSIPTYLIGGSGVALVLLWMAARRGILTAHEAGLGTTGWTAWRRVLGLVLILSMGLGGYLMLPAPPTDSPESQQPPVAEAAKAVVDRSQPAGNPAHPKPGWGDYCVWFVHLLSASLAELLVFCSLSFCLLEKYLRSRGLNAFLAWLLAAAFASVAFGLYHYTHEPRWYKYVWLPLMPVMMMNLAYFGLTRNFYLTLMLHNAFAAVGFTQEQYYSTYPPQVAVDPATYLVPAELWPVLLSFLVPFVLLHVVECCGFRGTQVVKS